MWPNAGREVRPLEKIPLQEPVARQEPGILGKAWDAISFFLLESHRGKDVEIGMGDRGF